MCKAVYKTMTLEKYHLGFLVIFCVKFDEINMKH